MKALFLLILSFLFFLNANNEDSNFFDKIKEATALKENQLAAILIIDIGSCPKCYDQSKIFYDHILDSLNNDNIKRIFFLNVKRKREVKYYKNKYNWNGYVFPNSYKLKRYYKLNALDFIIFVDSNGNKLSSVNNNDIENNYSQIFRDTYKRINIYFNSKN